MTPKLKKVILNIFTMITGLVLVSFFAITIGRVSLSGNNMSYSLQSYASQSFLNFNNYGLDAGGTREGDRTATLFKKMLGFRTANNYQERRQMYSHMKMNDAIFYTFIGDFTLDYGPQWAFVILLICSLLFMKALSTKRNYDFAQLLLFFLLYQICMTGFTLFTYSSFGGNLKLILTLLICFIIKKTTKIKFTK
jgi:hypothetical protein